MVCKCLDVDREVCTWAQACCEQITVYRTDMFCMPLRSCSQSRVGRTTVCQVMERFRSYGWSVVSIATECT